MDGIQTPRSARSSLSNNRTNRPSFRTSSSKTQSPATPNQGNSILLGLSEKIQSFMENPQVQAFTQSALEKMGKVNKVVSPTIKALVDHAMTFVSQPHNPQLGVNIFKDLKLSNSRQANLKATFDGYDGGLAGMASHLKLSEEQVGKCFPKGKELGTNILEHLERDDKASIKAELGSVLHDSSLSPEEKNMTLYVIENEIQKRGVSTLCQNNEDTDKGKALERFSFDKASHYGSVLQELKSEVKDDAVKDMIQHRIDKFPVRNDEMKDNVRNAVENSSPYSPNGDSVSAVLRSLVNR